MEIDTLIRVQCLRNETSKLSYPDVSRHSESDFLKSVDAYAAAFHTCLPPERPADFVGSQDEYTVVRKIYEKIMLQKAFTAALSNRSEVRHWPYTDRHQLLAKVYEAFEPRGAHTVLGSVTGVAGAGVITLLTSGAALNEAVGGSFGWAFIVGAGTLTLGVLAAEALVSGAVLVTGGALGYFTAETFSVNSRWNAVDDMADSVQKYLELQER